jgi:hypothetical protein
MKKSLPQEVKPTRRVAVASLLARPLTASAADAPGSDEELLKVREGVWRDWFGGHRAALLKILPPDFVGIGAGDGPFRNRAETIADSEGFAAATSQSGASNTVGGRCTEIFLRSERGWLHPGWHLDSGR